ncbi:MAG: hypothetical protein LBU50_06840 [Cellulomonas sp.]|nr:hypothetical protein [Cellulomonas sp.]
MRLTTLLRAADPLPAPETNLSARARAELRGLVGPDPTGAERAHANPLRRRHVRTLMPAGAALAAVAVFVVPLLQPPVQNLPAVPADPPSPTPFDPTEPGVTGSWVETAPSPLDGRRDPVTAWVGGSFLVVGGTTTPPCTDPNGCTEDEALLADGARYRPDTDTWTPVADAPIPLTSGGGAANPYPRTAVIGHTVYTLQVGNLVAYDADTDRWATLPAPPDTVALAGATNDALIAYPAAPCGETMCDSSNPTTTYLSYDPATAAWSTHTADLALPTNLYGATVVGGRLVVSWMDGNALGVGAIDLAGGAVTVQPDLGTSQRPVPVPVGDWAVWPRDPATAWFWNPTTQDWSMAEPPTRPGPFRVNVGAWGRELDLPIVTAGMVALGGHLYDPATRLWSPASALPVPTHDPILATGPEMVLACGGWNATSFARACYTLRPAPASQPAP